jgi:hypothetical protein
MLFITMVVSPRSPMIKVLEGMKRKTEERNGPCEMRAILYRPHFDHVKGAVVQPGRS